MMNQKQKLFSYTSDYRSIFFEILKSNAQEISYFAHSKLLALKIQELNPQKKKKNLLHMY